MLLFFLTIYVKSSLSLFISTENRISSRNLTCRDNFTAMTTVLVDCEACLITYRNYAIKTNLSLTGSGSVGTSYTCLKVNDVEAYHENLLNECRYYPRTTLDGYDDFCIASSYTYIRGSYRACICTTSNCNFSYTQCVRQTNLYTHRESPPFTNTILKLTDQIQCYQHNKDFKQQTYSSLKPLCSDDDNQCKSYLISHGVLCAITVDQSNQITRQSLTPSIYPGYLIKHKTEYCNSSTWTSKSIYFSQCKRGDNVCMCAIDRCNKDLETCRASNEICKNSYSILFFLISVVTIFYLKSKSFSQ